MTAGTPFGRWIGASYALGREVLFGERYPHICQATVTGRLTGVQVRLLRRDCAACAHEVWMRGAEQRG